MQRTQKSGQYDFFSRKEKGQTEKGKPATLVIEQNDNFERVMI